MRLYDGYLPDGAADRPLEGRARAELPRALRSLTADPADRLALRPLFDRARAQADRLKSAPLRAAYSEALTAWEKGAGHGALDRKLDRAVREKNRHFADRIAQTELARAHQAQKGAELMADQTVDVVQVRTNPLHPLTDICDIHARADLWGLGPGCYPKAKAPQTPYHPDCRCKLRSRPDLNASAARQTPNGAGTYLRSLTPAQAARVMGSQARAAAVMSGAPVDAVVNAGKDPLYRLRRLGDGAGHPLMRAESKSVNEAYETAKQPGGKHHGWYLQQKRATVGELSSGVDSFMRQIAKHEGWIADPLTKTADFYSFDPRRQAALVVGWQQDIQRHRDCIEILRGVIQEKST